MKNYYELNKEDRGKYLKEFRKTFVASIISLLTRCNIVSLFIFVLVVILEAFLEGDGFELYMVIGIVICIDFITLAHCIISEICFARWLKLKYKIQN